jgi:hypothetical protein
MNAGHLALGSARVVVVGGSVAGGSNTLAGSIALGVVGTLTIGGDVVGGTGTSSGEITTLNVTKSISIGGDLVGGTDASQAGRILVTGDVARIALGGSLFGGTRTTGGPIEHSGAIMVTGRLGELKVGGDLIGGTSVAGDDLNLGAVRAGVIGAMTVSGSVVGSLPFLITGQGSTSSVKGRNVAIASLTVQGDFENAAVLAGYTITGSTIGGDGGVAATAQIGTITVRQDWRDSVAAVAVSNGADGIWGTADDALLPPAVGASIVRSVASVAIGGLVESTSLFVGERIARFALGDSIVPIPTGAFERQIGTSALSKIVQLA